MPNWKKVILSGSNAELNALTMSGNIVPDTDNTLSLGASDNRFLLNGGTPVTVTGSGTANTLTRFQGATTVEDSKITSTDTQTIIEHDNSGSNIFIVSGANGQMLSISDEVGEKLFTVNNSSGLEVFSVSSSGNLVMPNLTYTDTDFVLSYDSGSGIVRFVSSSATLPDGVVSGSAQTIANLPVGVHSGSNGSLTVQGEVSLANLGDPYLIETSIPNTRVTVNGFITATNSITASAFTGSFVGDGSGLTNVTATITEEATVAQTFTSANTASVSHNFGTKNVIVTVYDNNDDQFIPSRINTPDVNTAVVYMDPSTTGRVVVAKGGHLVSGSIYKELISGTTSSVITHSLQEEFPIVQLYESASREMFIPQTIKAVDEDSVEITLSELIDCYVVVRR